MSWTLVVNAFAGTLGALSIGYLAWAVWIFVRGLPTNGRVPNQRPMRRKSPWTPHYSR